MADNGHDITMPARLGPQNAKAILGIMKRDALDETGKNLLRLILGRVFHDRCGRITSCTHAILLNLAIGWQRWLRNLASRLNLFQRNPDGAVCSIVERRKYCFHHFHSRRAAEMLRPD
jgi:hypothetical protein